MASSSISTYYIRFERIATDSVKLTVCSDSTYTVNLPGSPIKCAIDPTITGLNTVQHGTNTWGTSTRLANASIENDYICDNITQPVSACNEVVFTNNFSSVTGWTTVTTGSANISAGQFNLVNAYGSAYNKTYYSLSNTISDTYFKAECKYTITGLNPTGNGVGTLIMGLTAGTLDFYSYDASSSFAATSQDAIGVDINSPSASDNNVNDWQIFIASKKGSTLTSSSAIMASSSISTYYVRFERVKTDSVRLSVFSDSTFTVNLPGSPITCFIDSTITGLNTVQHGTNTWGSSVRLTNASIDNDYICDNLGTEGIQNIVQETSLKVYPNPTNGKFSIAFPAALSSEVTLRIYDDMGKMVFEKTVKQGTELITIDLSGSLRSGLYNIILQDNSGIKTQKIIVTK